MKKIFNIYSIIWAIAFITFNAITFISVYATCGFKALLPSFWVGYVFITATLIVNLVISFALSKPENSNKSFLNLSVGYIAYTALICSTIVGAITMAVATIPWWVGFVINMVVFAIYAFSIIGGNTAATIVDEVDNKVKNDTMYIKTLTVDAQTLLSNASNDNIKESVSTVYESIRYSDPMSCAELSTIESSISTKFNEYKSAVESNENDNVKSLEKELLNLINERNNKCKVLK